MPEHIVDAPIVCLSRYDKEDFFLARVRNEFIKRPMNFLRLVLMDMAETFIVAPYGNPFLFKIPFKKSYLAFCQPVIKTDSI